LTSTVPEVFETSVVLPRTGGAGVDVVVGAAFDEDDVRAVLGVVGFVVAVVLGAVASVVGLVSVAVVSGEKHDAASKPDEGVAGVVVVIGAEDSPWS
jgi:hypothetical protein